MHYLDLSGKYRPTTLRAVLRDNTVRKGAELGQNYFQKRNWDRLADMNTKSKKHYVNALGNRLAVVSKGKVVDVKKALMGNFGKGDVETRAYNAVMGYKEMRYLNRDVKKYSGWNVSLDTLDKAYERMPRIKGVKNAFKKAGLKFK